MCAILLKYTVLAIHLTQLNKSFLDAQLACFEPTNEGG